MLSGFRPVAPPCKSNCISTTGGEGGEDDGDLSSAGLLLSDEKYFLEDASLGKLSSSGEELKSCSGKLTLTSSWQSESSTRDWELLLLLSPPTEKKCCCLVWSALLLDLKLPPSLLQLRFWEGDALASGPDPDRLVERTASKSIVNGAAGVWFSWSWWW